MIMTILQKLTDKWDRRFLDLADHISAWSKDSSTKVGCVIVDTSKRVRSLGYNGFPVGVNDDVEERQQRPEKYLWTEHAERNAIYTAARTQTNLEDCILYCNYLPCADCARAIIQTGISCVVYKHENVNGAKESSNWEATKSISKRMLKEAGVELIKITDT